MWQISISPDHYGLLLKIVSSLNLYRHFPQISSTLLHIPFSLFLFLSLQCGKTYKIPALILGVPL
jgi:hypothetical protein